MTRTKHPWFMAGRWLLLGLAWVVAVFLVIQRLHHRRSEAPPTPSSTALLVSITNPEDAPPEVPAPIFTVTGRRYSHGRPDTSLGTLLDGQRISIRGINSYDALRVSQRSPGLDPGETERTPVSGADSLLEFRFRWTPPVFQEYRVSAYASLDGVPHAIPRARVFLQDSLLGETDPAGSLSFSYRAPPGGQVALSVVPPRSAGRRYSPGRLERVMTHPSSAMELVEQSFEFQQAAVDSAHERSVVFASADGELLEGVVVDRGPGTAISGSSAKDGAVTLPGGGERFRATWGDCTRDFVFPVDRHRALQVTMIRSRTVVFRNPAGEGLPGVTLLALPSEQSIGISDAAGRLSFLSCSAEFRAVKGACAETFRSSPEAKAPLTVTFECEDECEPLLEACRQDLEGAQHVLTAPEGTYPPEDQGLVQRAVDRAGHRLQSTAMACAGTERLDLFVCRAMAGALRTRPSLSDIEGVIADARRQLTQVDLVDVEAPLILYRGVARLRLGQWDDARADFSLARAKAQGRRTRYLERVLLEAEEFEMSARYREWRETGETSLLDQALALWERWDARIARGGTIDPALQGLAERMGRVLQAETRSVPGGDGTW